MKGQKSNAPFRTCDKVIFISGSGAYKIETENPGITSIVREIFTHCGTQRDCEWGTNPDIPATQRIENCRKCCGEMLKEGR